MNLKFFLFVFIGALVLFLLLFDFIYNIYPRSQKKIKEAKDLDEVNRIKTSLHIMIMRLLGLAFAIILGFWALISLRSI